MQRVYALLFLILAACCLVGQCQQSCQANHAGPHCDPLCSQRGSVTAPSDPGGYGQFLAFSQQPACTRAMTLQIDSHCGTLTLQIDSIGTSPTLTLYSNLSATFVTPTDPPNAQTSFFVAKYNVEPGQYVVIPVADSKSCLITAQAISDLSVVIGAVSGGTQSVYSDTPSKELTSGVASYPVMHAFNLPKPGAITRITFFQNGNQNYGAPTAVRYRCAYDVYAGYLYTCNSASSYRYMAEGFDENGYKFMRSDRMPCIAAPPPTTSTPPTTTTESACLSGGTLVALRECLCPPFYTGSRCETMMCYNGGTLMGNNTCFCQIGYSGTFCQDGKDCGGFGDPRKAKNLRYPEFR
uniref:EGF-like domain-containing protein n=1 Tax=Plectus sambesii TaxID=2011161 RepID=A0A914XA92_9BILA